MQSGHTGSNRKDTKTHCGRSVPIHPEVRNVLGKILKVPSLYSDRLFHRDGQSINEHHIRTAHEDTCKQAGIADFTLHDFRHTCINNWRKAHHDYFKIMAASGHKTISVFKRYNLVNESEVKTLVEETGMDTYVDTKANVNKY